MGELAAGYKVLQHGTLWSSTAAKCKGYAVANPGEARLIDAYVAALDAGAHAVPPQLQTDTGRGIVAMLAALAPKDPPPTPVGYGIGVSTHVMRYANRDAYLDLLPPNVRLIRDDVTWSGTERVKGQYDWSQMDTICGLAWARDLKVILMIGYAPPWANGGRQDKIGPTNTVDFGNWAAAAAARAATKWGDTVVGIEPWNEPNIDFLIHPTTGAVGDPLFYSALVKAAYPRMKVAAPAIPVIGGCTAGVGVHVWNEPIALWTEAVLADGMPFDEWSDHTYEYSQPGQPPETGAQMARIDVATSLGRTFWHTGVESLADQLGRHGHPACVIHSTEGGAPTFTPAGKVTPRGAPEQNLADWFTLAYPRWRSQPHAGWFVPYTLQDPDSWDTTDEQNHFGAVRSDGVRKPLWYAIAAAG